MVGYAVASLRGSLQYRANFIGFLVLTALTYGFRLAFMDRLVDIGDGSVGGWSREQVLSLYYVGIVVSLLSWSVASSIDEFFRHAHRGDLEAHLMRPVSVLTLLTVRWIAGPNLLALLVVVPLAVVDQWHSLVGVAPLNLVAAALGVLLATVAVTSTMLIVYSLTLVLQRQVPVDYVFSELFRLVQVPPTVFTGAWIGLLVVGLPLVVGVWAPVAALGGSFVPLLWLVGVVALTVSAAVLTVRRSLGSFDGLGG